MKEKKREKQKKYRTQLRENTKIKKNKQKKKQNKDTNSISELSGFLLAKYCQFFVVVNSLCRFKFTSSNNCRVYFDPASRGKKNHVSVSQVGQVPGFRRIPSNPRADGTSSRRRHQSLKQPLSRGRQTRKPATLWYDVSAWTVAHSTADKELEREH